VAISVLAAVVALLVWQETATVAQGPLRLPPVRIPGTDVVLDDGWMLVYTDGTVRRCMYAVPPAWMVSGHGWSAMEPHGNAMVEVSLIEYPQWSALRAAVQAAQPSATWREDTPNRFRIEGVDGSRTWQYVAEGDGAHACTANIEVKRADRVQEVVQKIASSVHVAHGSDLDWMKKR
jgi:hypothetical protein